MKNFTGFVVHSISPVVKEVIKSKIYDRDTKDTKETSFHEDNNFCGMCLTH